ncbi:hypothetical protein [Nocardia aurea]|uniref:Uncharacterized protein n=1 Tax=Nocardia aurea TaxID=2144174 RepID=A0ABV3FWH6_9NOCA
MDLRPELLPPPVAPEYLAALAREIERIDQLITTGDPDAAIAVIAAFNQHTGHDYDFTDFVEYSSYRDLLDFAQEAARPAHPRVPDITRDELVEIVRRIRAADPDADYYLLLFRTNVPHPAPTDLIYHPPADLRDATAEQIADAALAYRPIAL